MSTTGPNQPIETSNAPVGDALQPPAGTPEEVSNAPAAAPPVGAPPSTPAPPPPPPAPAPPAPSGHFFKAMAHALGGAILGTLAGAPPVKYTTDENGTQTPDPTQKPDHTRDRLKRIAEAALTGMAAGSQVHRPGANALAGMGAGFEAQQGKMQAQDTLARQQSKEQFEQQQKTLTDKYIRAQHNITTYSLFQKAMQENNDHDPERQRNLALQSAAEDYISHNPATSMTVKVVSEAEARAMQAADKTNPASVTHAFFPLGMREAKHDGKPVYDKDGVTPTSEGQLLMIGGGSDGKIALPQAFVDDLQKYGKMAGINNLDDVKSGSVWGIDRLLRANSLMNPIKEKVIDGWKEKTFGENAVKVGNQWMQTNAFDPSQKRPYPGVPPGADLKSAEAGAKRGEEAKFRAEAAKAFSESTGVEEQIAAQGIDLVEGDMVPSLQTKRSKDFNKIYNAARKYSMEKYGKPFDYEKADRDYKFASNIGTQNTLKYLNSLTGNPKDGTIGILDQLISISDGLKRSKFPAVSDLDAWQKLQKGDASYIPLFNFATDASDQFAKIMTGGGSGNVTSDKKIEMGLKMFRTGFSKDEMKASATSTKSMLSTRKREMIGDNIYLLKDYGETGWQEKRRAAQGGAAAPAQMQTPTAGKQSESHVAGDIIVQNNQNFKVTAVDANGKVTAAEAQ